MIARISEIEATVSELESVIKSLARDRDEAWAEVARMKQALDERELELLQTDEELQKVSAERDSVIRDKEETERRLDDVGERIKELLPMFSTSEDSSSQNADENY